MSKWLNETRLQSLINEIKSRFSKRPTIWSGTKAEWDALTPAEQAQYSVKMITDDETGATVNAVIDGDMRAVTSNAVYDALHKKDVSVSTDGYFRGWTDAQGLKHVRYRRQFDDGAVRLGAGNQNVVMGSLAGLDSKYHAIVSNYTSATLTSFTPFFVYGNNLVVCHHQIWRSNDATNTYSIRIAVAGSGSYSNAWGMIIDFMENPT